jgi:predicted permease
MGAWLCELRKRFRPFRTDADIGDELQAHLDALIEDGVARGLSFKEARRRARLQLGVPQAIVEKVREVEMSTVVETWYRDFTLGLRSLRRSPVFAMTAILTLAVGIGANTVIFTLLYGLLLRGLPVHSPEELVRVGVDSTSSGSNAISAIPYQMFLQIRSQQKSLTDISAWSSRGVTIDNGDGAPRILGVHVASGNGFDVLGMTAYLGRLLTAADDVRGGPPHGWSAVLGYRFWRDTFGGDPSIIGRQIKLSNTIVTVVGVAPPEFHGVRAGSEIAFYLPFQFIPVLDGKDLINTPGSYTWCNTFGRLKPGVSAEEAQAELAVYGKALLRRFTPQEFQEHPFGRNAFLKLESARTGLPTFFGRVYSTPLYLMQGLVGIVLLLCCVNISGLMMSKVHSRRQEFAIRTAIGAARWRLVRQYLTESFVIALAGAALGAATAWHGTAYLLPFFRHPNEGIGMSVEPDRAIFLVTGFFAILTTLLFGTLPAWRAGGADPGSLLKSRTSGAARRRILGRTFIPVQVALSFALVSIASLLSQSLVRLQTEPTGFDLDHVTIQTAPFHLLNLSEDARLDLYHRMRDRMQQLPGIHSVSFTRLTPMTSFQAASSFQAVGAGPSPPEDSHMAYNDVGPGYFRTMKTTILMGREFEENERDRSVCVLNQAAAAYLFPRREAIGQYVRSTDSRRFPQEGPCRVIGLAQDAKYANLHEPAPRTIYFPVNADSIRYGGNHVFLISAPTKAQAIAAYNKARSELSPSTPLVLFVTLREQMDAALGSHRALSLMSNFFAGLALFLSGLGLYGLLSSTVAQRTSEIGLRMALGAERGRVLRMILADALGLLTAGLVLGAAVLAAAIAFAGKILYGVSAFDPLRLAAITAVLAIIAILSGLAPAIRAASVDPVEALRIE